MKKVIVIGSLCLVCASAQQIYHHGSGPSGESSANPNGYNPNGYDNGYNGNDDEEWDSEDVWKIIGAIVGSLLLIIAFILIICCCISTALKRSTPVERSVNSQTVVTTGNPNSIPPTAGYAHQNPGFIGDIEAFDLPPKYDEIFANPAVQTSLQQSATIALNIGATNTTLITENSPSAPVRLPLNATMVASGRLF